MTEDDENAFDGGDTEGTPLLSKPLPAAGAHDDSHLIFAPSYNRIDDFRRAITRPPSPTGVTTIAPLRCGSPPVQATPPGLNTA